MHAATPPAPTLGSPLPARVDDAPRIYVQSLREQLGSTIRRHALEPESRTGSLLALGGGVLGGLLGRRFGHGLLGAGIGAALGGIGALGASLLPTALHDPRGTSGGALPRPRLDEAAIRELVNAETDLGRDTARPGNGPGALRNAHVSNTAEQLRMALAGSFDSLEGDVRLEDGVPVMAHDRGGDDALLFADWLRVGVATGKHLRIDLKEAAAVDQVSALLAQLDVPDTQVTFNLSTGDPLWDSDMELGSLRRLRMAHPGALIGFNPAKGRLGDELGPAIDAVRELGGPTMVSLALPRVQPGDVARLHAAGAFVGVWNDPTQDPVDDPAAVAARLRAVGIDGLVDLRRADDPFQS